jgi:hypothetical protein
VCFAILLQRATPLRWAGALREFLCELPIANSLPMKKARNFISAGAAPTSFAHEFDRSNPALDKK